MPQIRYLCRGGTPRQLWATLPESNALIPLCCMLSRWCDVFTEKKSRAGVRQDPGQLCGPEEPGHGHGCPACMSCVAGRGPADADEGVDISTLHTSQLYCSSSGRGNGRGGGAQRIASARPGWHSVSAPAGPLRAGQQPCHAPACQRDGCCCCCCCCPHSFPFLTSHIRSARRWLLVCTLVGAGAPVGSWKRRDGQLHP